MEMHQVRYFLCLARELNFTRAAEVCNVSQPSLTRAISGLEAEFGGDLFRRERRNTHLTQLGDRMLPILRQCYESAQSAKALATAVKTGEKASLTIAVGDAVDIALIVPPLKELTRVFKGLELAFVRGSQEKIAEDLKSGATEVAVTASLDQPWDRLDAWPLFTEPFVFACNRLHRLADRSSFDLLDLLGEHYVVGSSCDVLNGVSSALKVGQKDSGVDFRLLSEHDCLALIEADLAVGFLSARFAKSDCIRFASLGALELTRSICVYGVSGRQRSPAASALIQLLRAADWSAVAVERSNNASTSLPPSIRHVSPTAVAPTRRDKLRKEAADEKRHMATAH